MHYFSTAGIKHHDQGDKEKGGFIRAPRGPVTAGVMATGGWLGDRNSRWLISPTRSRKRTGNRASLWPSKPTSSEVFPSTMPHLLILLKRCHQLGTMYLST